jgi:sulfopyruvate decarboxylase TPP-binding subunit
MKMRIKESKTIYSLYLDTDNGDSHLICDFPQEKLHEILSLVKCHNENQVRLDNEENG